MQNDQTLEENTYNRLYTTDTTLLYSLYSPRRGTAARVGGAASMAKRSSTINEAKSLIAANRNELQLIFVWVAEHYAVVFLY